MNNFVVTSLSSSPNLTNTLSINTDVYLGQNQIRRNVGHNVSVYTGTITNDQYVDLQPTDTYRLTFQTTTKIVVLRTNNPVVISFVVAGVTRVLTVTRLLILDSAMSELTITNNGTVTAQFQISYAC